MKEGAEMEEKRPDLHISGVNTASGGHYRSVTIEGVGKVNGNMQTDSLLRMNGLVTVRGDVRTPELNGEGKIKIEGSLSAVTSKIEGYADILGSFDGDTMVLKGMLNVRGDCRMERFEAEGGFEIDGLLNADLVDVRLFGRGKVREIGGETIRARKMAQNVWKKLWQRMFPKWNPELVADTIEGDEVDLENTVASIVRGNRVIIGLGCRIGRVEYRSELIKHPSAKVGEERKSGDGNHFA
jgi:cytoskeletal protein CcmA (bactofilin family)